MSLKQFLNSPLTSQLHESWIIPPLTLMRTFLHMPFISPPSFSPVISEFIRNTQPHSSPLIRLASLVLDKAIWCFGSSIPPLIEFLIWDQRKCHGVRRGFGEINWWNPTRFPLRFSQCSYLATFSISHCIRTGTNVAQVPQLQGVQKFVDILTPLFSLAWVSRSGSYSTCWTSDVAGFVWCIKLWSTIHLLWENSGEK